MNIRDKIRKALEELNDPSKHPCWLGDKRYVSIDYVERALLELLDNSEEDKNGK